MKTKLTTIGIIAVLGCSPWALSQEPEPREEKPKAEDEQTEEKKAGEDKRAKKDKARPGQKQATPKDGEKATDEKARKRPGQRGRPSQQDERKDAPAKDVTPAREDPAKEKPQEEPPAKGESVQPNDKKPTDEVPKETESKEQATKDEDPKDQKPKDKDLVERKMPDREKRADRPSENRERVQPADREGERIPPQRPAREGEDGVARQTPPDEKQPAKPESAPDEVPDGPVVTKEEEQARKNSAEEASVREATTKLDEQMEQKKLAVKKPEEAKSLISEILGADSALSVAEERRARRGELASPVRGERRGDRATDDRRDLRVNRFAEPERREAADYLVRRLRGEQAVEPEVLRRGVVRDPRRASDDRQRGDRRGDRYSNRTALPYYHEGRRYASFRSRSDIPAILLASAVLNRVNVTNYREVPYLHSGQVYQDPAVSTWVTQPPSAYREGNAQVVSYKVVEDSMISRDDVLFLQGSTQFADPRSYDVIALMAEAMADSSVRDQRFVVEGHASREGSYDANMELSQRRAERIVRDIVRYGISPDRLIPVGYGESEARSAADDPEYLRRQDRRVVVFRLEDPA